MPARLPHRVFMGAVSLLLSTLSAASAGAVEIEGPLFAVAPPRFVADLSTSLDSTGSATLQVDIQVPYTECQFVRVGTGMGAALEFLVVARDGGGRQAAGDVWIERLMVASFDEARDGTARLETRRAFKLRPGKYKLRVEVRDSNSGLASEAERELVVAGLDKGGLGLGGLVFGECAPDSATGAEVFARNVLRRYAGDLARFCVRSTILDRRPPAGDRPYRIHYRVVEETVGELLRGDTLLAAGTREFTLRPRVANLFLGAYTLAIRVEEGGRKWEVEGAFAIETVTAPTGSQWKTLVEILEYVAEPSELEPLRRAQGEEERERLWKQFWDRRDPSPGTPGNEALLEFMRRVRVANSQFSGLGPGWRSDQGRIYIRHGTPDQVEDLPATQEAPPLQIWHYLSLNRRFVFADRQGFGHYELVNEVTE